MPKKVITGFQAFQVLLSGARKLCDAVAVTLGPAGRTVVIGSQFGAPRVTKDGVTVAKECDFEGDDSVGSNLVKQAAIKTNDSAGDGTTSTTILAYAMIENAERFVASKSTNVNALLRGMNIAVEHAVKKLKEIAKPVSSREDIKHIATISSNDSQIGEIVADAMGKIGETRAIVVEESSGIAGIQLKSTDGMSFDRGYISPYFITDTGKSLVDYEKPSIFIYEKKISSVHAILPILETALSKGKPLVIIAEDIDGDALAALILNKLRGGLKVVAIKAPGFGDRRKAMLQDLAILTGATLFSDDTGDKIESATLAHCGSCDRIVISKDQTTVVGGAGNKEDVTSRVAMIRAEIQNSTSDYDKEKLEERVAKLSSGVSVIQVGGLSEPAMKEAKDRVDDAKNAAIAAVREGLVAGGGSTLIYLSKQLEGVKGSSQDEDAGITIVKNALLEVSRRLFANLGLDPDRISAIINELMAESKPSKVYDGRTHQICDGFKVGVLDPATVVRVSVESAASVAGSIISSQVVIVNKPEDKARGGMNGMHDHMDY